MTAVDPARYRASCDSIVAVGAATDSGHTLFAKNSDRMPADECQPLSQIEAADHPRGAKLRCQYIEIDQVEHTNRVLLSSPYWLWGAEHGVNEHAVAIGNHTIFTRDEVAATGLLGMDLVRLALERASSAVAAVDVIIELIERHGQGGSGYVDTDWPYHNSFVVADPRSAFVLEASAGNWVVREVDRWAAGTNHTTIGADWSRSSARCREHAAERGWLVENAGRIDFAASYRDTSLIPAVVSSGRYRASTNRLARGDGELDTTAFRRIMRDHYESGDVYEPGPAPEDERFFCVCRHDVAGPTTASMVVELVDPAESPLLCHVALCNPCIGPYIPVFPAGRVPTPMCTGGAEPASGAAWWRFKALLSRIEQDPLRLGPWARDAWVELQAELDGDAHALRARLAATSSVERVERETSELMEITWGKVSTRLDQLNAELDAG